MDVKRTAPLLPLRVERKGKTVYYFPYPDPIVHFAYQMPQYDKNATQETVSAQVREAIEPISNQLNLAFPGVESEIARSPTKYLIIFPIDSGNLPKTFYQWIGYLQYISQVSSILNRTIFPSFIDGYQHEKMQIQSITKL
jgi:hypothetical protein